MDRFEVLWMGWMQNFWRIGLTIWCSSGRIGWAVRIGRRPVVMRVWSVGGLGRCGRSDHVDTGCRGLGGSRGACRIVLIGRSLGRHLAGLSGRVEYVLGLLTQCIRAVGLTHGLARGNRLAR